MCRCSYRQASVGCTTRTGACRCDLRTPDQGPRTPSAGVRHLPPHLLCTCRGTPGPGSPDRLVAGQERWDPPVAEREGLHRCRTFGRALRARSVGRLPATGNGMTDGTRGHRRDKGPSACIGSSGGVPPPCRRRAMMASRQDVTHAVWRRPWGDRVLASCPAASSRRLEAMGRRIPGASRKWPFRSGAPIVLRRPRRPAAHPKPLDPPVDRVRDQPQHGIAGSTGLTAVSVNWNVIRGSSDHDTPCENR